MIEQPAETGERGMRRKGGTGETYGEQAWEEI